MKRPIWITILAICSWVSATESLLVAFFFLLIVKWPGAVALNPELHGFLTTLWRDWYLPPLLILSMLQIIVGIGLWTLRNWARILTIIFSCLSIMATLGFFVVGHYLWDIHIRAFDFVGISVPAIIIVCLSRHEVRNVFVS